MARATKHGSEEILDAALGAVLDGGPRAAGVAAIAAASGAPVGTLYHRFGSRDELLAAVWLRALERFRDVYLVAAAEPAESAESAESADPMLAAAAMAAAVIAFARLHPADARLLLVTGLAELLDAPPSEQTRARLQAINAPIGRAIRGLARRRYGRADRRHLDRVRLAVVDLPMGALRRWAHDGKAPPRWAEAEVAAAAAGILSEAGERGTRVVP